MLPLCFSSPRRRSVSNSNSSSYLPQSLITSIYQAHHNLCCCCCNSPTALTFTWAKAHFTNTLTVYSPDCFSITITIHPSNTAFSFLKARPGSKSIHVTHPHNENKLKLHWDFSRAKFVPNSAEPESCFYVAITCNGELGFFLGDMLPELTHRAGLKSGLDAPGPRLLSRREHVFGRKIYTTRAVFMGSVHEIGIECGGGGVLQLKVDGEIKLRIGSLSWKFRGNERILIGDVEVEFYWDVFNWLNKCGSSSYSHGRYGNGYGHGVFVFQVGDGGVWPEMVGAEKKLIRKSLSSTPACLSPSPSCSSVLQWAEESSDSCGRSSCSSSTRSSGSNAGFSLLLYAWRKD